MKDFKFQAPQKCFKIKKNLLCFENISKTVFFIEKATESASRMFFAQMSYGPFGPPKQPTTTLVNCSSSYSTRLADGSAFLILRKNAWEGIKILAR